MTKLDLAFGHPDRGDAFLNELLQGILDANTLMSVATVREGRSYINTAYFCFNEKLDLFFLSSPDSRHCLNLADNASVALSVYDSHQDWDQPKRGLQLFGDCAQTQGLGILEAGRLYMQRFAGFKKWVAHIDDLTRNAIHSKLYVARIHEIKVFHDEILGEREMLTLTPQR